MMPTFRVADMPASLSRGTIFDLLIWTSSNFLDNYSMNQTRITALTTSTSSWNHPTAANTNVIITNQASVSRLLGGPG